MAVVYTVQDIEAYKAAMARHAAKNNRLIEKWTGYRDLMKRNLGELFCHSPSEARDKHQAVLEKAIDVAEAVLRDLSAPADAEISVFEWRNCK